MHVIQILKLKNTFEYYKSKALDGSSEFVKWYGRVYYVLAQYRTIVASNVMNLGLSRNVKHQDCDPDYKFSAIIKNVWSYTSSTLNCLAYF